MTSNTLSLVVPVYNVAAYLPACLESIACQSRAPDEIIVVDDGSTDACPQILRDYAVRLPHMRVIRQKNGGLSAARNTGLAHATGEWLAFLDSDDRLDPHHCEFALTMATSDDLDVALFNGWFDFEERQPEQLIYPCIDDSAVMPGAAWLRSRLLQRALFHFVWLHLYRRRFIENLGLRFVAPWIHEDVPWTTRMLVEARRVRYSPRPLVHYRKPIRPAKPGPAQDERLGHLIRSSAFNVRFLDELIATLRDRELANAIAWQLVDGGLSIFHHMAKVDSSSARRKLRRALRHDGIYAILWRHATTTAQHRRIARNWLKSFA